MFYTEKHEHRNIGLIVGIFIACVVLVVIVVLVVAWRKGIIPGKFRPASDQQNFVRFSSDYGCTLDDKLDPSGGSGSGNAYTNGNTQSATSVTLSGSDFGGSIIWCVIITYNPSIKNTKYIYILERSFFSRWIIIVIILGTVFIHYGKDFVGFIHPVTMLCLILRSCNHTVRIKEILTLACCLKERFSWSHYIIL